MADLLLRASKFFLNYDVYVILMDHILKLLLGQSDMFRKECSCVHSL